MYPHRIALLLTLASALVCWTATTAAGDINDGLAAYWPFDEGSGSTVHDASGNDNDGTISGAAWVPGFDGSALEIVGTDIVTGIPATFDDAVTTGLTVCAWLYWYGEHPGTYSFNSYIFDARTYHPRGGFIPYLWPDGAIVLVMLPASGPVQQFWTPPSVVPTYEWTHVAVVFDIDVVRFYRNGFLVNSAGPAGPYARTSGSAAIGNNRWAPGDGQWAPFNGILDELRIYHRALDASEIPLLLGRDCNQNGIPDSCDVDCGQPGGPCDVPGCGQSDDCTGNGIPDECEPDCNSNGIPDDCDIASGTSQDCGSNGVPNECEPDCNTNGIPDDCDIASGTSQDCGGNGVPNECEPDCNSNGIPDDCDIASGTSQDCNRNNVPDECDLASGTSQDCNENAVPDECELDCNDNDIPDVWDIASGTSQDCNSNSIPDECDLASGRSEDCNGNGIPDECDIAAGTSQDCNSNSIPDECDIAAGTSEDCNGNGIPDECEPDCNGNSIADSCDIARWTSPDCNDNAVPDECDVADGTSADCTSNGVPDECEIDCDASGTADVCEIAAGTSRDCNGNGVADDCDIWIGAAVDANFNGQPDACETCPPGFGDANADGLITGQDYLELASCLGGPGTPAGGACYESDFDGDCDVDLGDYGAFQDVFADGLAPGACCGLDGSCGMVSNWTQCVTSGGVFAGFGTTCATADCRAFPSVTTVRSLASHFTLGELGIPITPSAKVESRMQGIQLLEIRFDRPMKRYYCEAPGHIHVHGVNNPNVPVTSAVMNPSRTVLRVSLSAPNRDCYVVELIDMRSAALRPLPLAERTFSVIGLVGDVNGDRVVGMADRNMIDAYWNQVPSEAAGTVRIDLDVSGIIFMGDRNVVTSAANWGATAPNCGN